VAGPARDADRDGVTPEPLNLFEYEEATAVGTGAPSVELL